MDLGLDRDDVVGALDAFGEAVERRIDLALLGERVFVNNVTMGLYAKIVQSPEYRDHKIGTALDLLPAMLGPDALPFDLRFTGPDGSEHPSAHVILVSNGRYDLTGPQAFGSRRALDGGTLGIVTAELARRRSSPASSRCRRWVAHHDSGVGARGPTPVSRCDRARRWRSVSTAKRSCSTHRLRSASCRARFGCVSPPAPRDVRRPRRPHDRAGRRSAPSCRRLQATRR